MPEGRRGPTSAFKRLLPLALLLLSAPLFAHAAEFDPTTRAFRAGDKVVSAGGHVTIKTAGAERLSGAWMVSTPVRKWMKPKYFLSGKTETDAAGGTLRYRARIPLTKEGKTAGFSQTTRLTEDGLIHVRTELTFDEAGDRSLAGDGGFYQFTVNASKMAGETFQAGDEVKTFAEWYTPESNAVARLFDRRDTWLTFFPDDPARSFGVKSVVGRAQLIDYRLATRNAYVELRIVPQDGVTEFLVRLPESESPGEPIGKEHAGINFFKRDRIHVPDYSLCRNLVQNPSFEAGFRYWGPVQCYPGTACGFDDFAAIDDTVAYRGRRSLRHTVRAGEAPPLTAHFAVPVVPGKAYTFSFYAKADRPKVKTSVLAITDSWGNFPISKRMELTTDWQRYTFPVTAPKRVLHIGLGERWWDNRENSGQLDGARIWFDCVQLEAGELTDYAEKPIIAELVTGQYGHTFDAREPREMDVVVRNLTAAPREVAVTLTVKDFFDRKRHREQFSVAVPAGGSAARRLALTQVLGTGAYVLAAELSDGAFAETDYFRVSVIRSLSNTHRNKDLCGIHFRNPYRLEKRAEFLMRTGIGSGIGGGGAYFGTFPSEAHYGILAKYRIKPLSSIFEKHVTAGNLRLTKPEAYTLEGHARIEQACYERAKSMPYLAYWKLINEPEATGFPDRLDGVSMEDLVQALKAAYRGIKRGNPRALVISPDPCNMYERGRRWLERYIRAGGLEACDVVAIHIYRPCPEDPDMDADAKRLFDLLDGLGYKGPVWWTEGIYYAPYNIPEIGLDPYQTITDHYRCGAFGYDSGRSEKIAASRNARSYLVGFKYHARIGMNVDWGTRYHQIDFDETPNATLFAQNALGNMLGNAVYRQDVDLGAGVRTYVFENERREPVAVMWNFHPKVERFEKPAPNAAFAFAPGAVRAVDFMMNEIPATGPTLELPVTPYPLFLVGAPGALPEFVHTLEKTAIKGADQKPFSVATRVKGAEAQITFTSLLSRGVKGAYAARIGAATVSSGALEIQGKGESRVAVQLADYMRPGALNDVPLSVRFTDTAGKQTEIDGSFRLGVCPRRRGPIAIDGALADWAGIPAVPLGKDHLKLFGKGKNGDVWRGDADLSASLRTAWDDTGLYLAVEVADDVLDLKPRREKDKDAWFMRDSLQVYFDTWADARFREDRGYDNNDYAYQFALTDAGPAALRDTVPEWQIAFLKVGKPDTVQTAVKRNGTRTVYEVFFPKREIVPIDMEPGTSFGFAILVNDKDNDDRKQGLTLTPAGTEPYMNPHLWPVWVLQK
ncbi:MAG: carbohydrate binding domain-containing protein [Kiritimatiellae bacterium]|nr:carbohydrate binding domain-containing protein [Kiritimatiellia bacterium]